MSLLPWCQSWGSTQCWRLCDIAFSQPGPGSLHRTTVLFYCAGQVLSEGTAAHPTPGSWKRFQGDGNHVFVTLSCSLWLSSRIYTDQQKIIIRAQINYHSRKGSVSQKWGSYSLPCQKWALKIKVLPDQKLRYKVNQWHLLLVCEHEVGWGEERSLCLFKGELVKKSLKAVTGTQHGAECRFGSPLRWARSGQASAY